jgi:(+)-trans-carveol dehydrogenase/(-)-trans-carveol dehydrogenase
VNRVAEKVALITGAARGQGRSHAVRLAEEGADIIAIDVCADIPGVPYPGATTADLEETVRLVRAQGRKVVACTADVRDLAGLQRAVTDGVSALGRLDIVCANAGVSTTPQPTHSMDAATWDLVLSINLTGVWHTCKTTVPVLIESGRGGSIVLISSVGGLKAYPDIGNYIAAKHGVVGLMRTLANELARHMIRVNSVHPTQVDTPMIMNEATFSLFLPDMEHPTRDDFAPASQATNMLPIPWVEPVDVSNAVIFLASDEARYITGVALPVDAGCLAKS